MGEHSIGWSSALAGAQLRAGRPAPGAHQSKQTQRFVNNKAKRHATGQVKARVRRAEKNLGARVAEQAANGAW